MCKSHPLPYSKPDESAAGKASKNLRVGSAGAELFWRSLSAMLSDIQTSSPGEVQRIDLQKL